MLRPCAPRAASPEPDPEPEPEPARSSSKWKLANERTVSSAELEGGVASTTSSSSSKYAARRRPDEVEEGMEEKLLLFTSRETTGLAVAPLVANSVKLGRGVGYA